MMSLANTRSYPRLLYAEHPQLRRANRVTIIFQTNAVNMRNYLYIANLMTRDFKYKQRLPSSAGPDCTKRMVIDTVLYK